MKDPRLGKRDKEGKLILAPTQTLTGTPIEGFEGTIGLGDGYFAILTFAISDETRNEAVAELQELIKPSNKVMK